MFLSKITKFKTDKKQSESKISGCFAYIVDSKGNLVVSYSYDAWGNIISKFFFKYGLANAKTSYSVTLGTTTYTAQDIDNLNGFYYRAYYLDKETNLYYLITRYYDPEVGRFISADDAKYLDFKVAYGHNYYVYCNNNPVMGYDPMGNFAISDGALLQVVTSVISYVGILVASIFDEQIRSDMDAIGWNPFNSDENATLESNKVSFYKGVPVFRIDLDRSGSFAAIFLNQTQDPDVLKHEIGHNCQLITTSIINYFFMIFLPSWLEWSNREYYERPWEITADVFGCVNERNHSQIDINRGYWYLGVSLLLGPLGYFFLFGEY